MQPPSRSQSPAYVLHGIGTDKDLEFSLNSSPQTNAKKILSSFPLLKLNFCVCHLKKN